MLLDVQYTIVYPEETITPRSSSWTLRQIGVFCHYSPNNEGNLWLLLHPKEDSLAQIRITQCLENSVSTQSNSNPWYHLHSLIFSSYLDNWRLYLAALNDELEGIADIALTLKFSTSSHYSTGYTQLRKLKHLEDKVLPLSARFRVTTQTLVTLKALTDGFQKAKRDTMEEYLEMSNSLNHHIIQMKGYLITTGLLEKRVGEILNLVSNSQPGESLKMI